MDERIVPLTEILRLNTLLFRNCLVGMTEEQSRCRPSPTTNHAAYVAAHVTNARFFLLKTMGAAQPSPLAPYLGSARCLDDVQQWPTLAETEAAWTRGGRALRDRLDAMTAADLDCPATPGFPREGNSRLSTLAFLVEHEAYHIGQLSLLRTYVGLPPMKYPS